MGWSWRIGRIAGINVYVHFTFLLLLAWVALEHYLAHGDLWDCAYDRARAPAVFLPLTLELGSWLWIKKNPLQVLRREGIFNPIKAHRVERVLRRHSTLLDFLLRAAYCAKRWLPAGDGRQQLMTRAI